jgi:hypothetical protein
MILAEGILIRELLHLRRTLRDEAPSVSCSSCQFMGYTGLRHGIGFECRKGLSGHSRWDWHSGKCVHYKRWTPVEPIRFCRR